MAFGEGLRAADDVQEIGVIRAGGRIEYATPRADEVLRGHCAAIGPFHAFAEVEEIRFAIRRHIPTLRHAGLRLTILIVTTKALKQRESDAQTDVIGCERGIDGLRLRALDEDEVRARLLRPTGGQQAAEDE